MKKIIIALIVFTIFSSCTSKQAEDKPSLVQGESNSSIVLYYGDTCPHCHDTLDWLKENDPDNTANISIKEVYNNSAYSDELQKAAQTCNIQGGIGVPFLFAENNCYIGTPDISNYLQSELKL